ncbi:hypothetical protein [Brevundimonas aurantiaca]|uniref:hypothetical protein n=1 Tax=Brevundimonas aurantiaca TaxID=74316 RepID=UPI00174D6E25|nr:hypothetical protein [Brevundimonas aurantiaca]
MLARISGFAHISLPKTIFMRSFSHLNEKGKKVRRIAMHAILPGAGLLSALAFIGTAASAQDRTEPKAEISDPIVVVGTKMTREEARRQAVTFVRGVGVPGGDRPAARWKDPVCPHVIGLEPAHAAIVERKLRAIAKEARVPVAKASCKTNIVITFASDAGALVRDVSARSRAALAEVPVQDRDALREGDAPIRWWYTTDVRGKDGMSASASAGAPPWTGGNAEGGGSVLPDTGRSLRQYSSSVVSTQAVRVLTSATVVIDVNLAEGRTLDTVTSYAAMVAFAEIKGAEFAPTSSILGAFESGGPHALTDWDLRFLRALYSLPLDRKARQQRDILVGALVAEADQP